MDEKDARTKREELWVELDRKIEAAYAALSPRQKGELKHLFRNTLKATAGQPLSAYARRAIASVAQAICLTEDTEAWAVRGANRASCSEATRTSTRERPASGRLGAEAVVGLGLGRRGPALGDLARLHPALLGRARGRPGHHGPRGRPTIHRRAGPRRVLDRLESRRPAGYRSRAGPCASRAAPLTVIAIGHA